MDESSLFENTLLLYYTPRAALLEYLELKNLSEACVWIEKGVSFLVKDAQKLADTWVQLTMSRTIKDYRAMPFFSAGLCESVQKDRVSFSYHSDKNGIYTIFRESKYLNYFVNYYPDYVDRPLTEWILRFLFEQINIDMVQWEDKRNLQFKIVNIDALAAKYCEVNNIITPSPSDYIKNVLDALSNSVVLNEIDRNSLHYQFGDEWFYLEIKKRKAIGQKESHALLAYQLTSPQIH